MPRKTKTNVIQTPRVPIPKDRMSVDVSEDLRATGEIAPVLFIIWLTVFTPKSAKFKTEEKPS